MNGRLFAKRWLAVMLLLFGFVGWMVGEGKGNEGGFPLFIVCVVLAILLFRRTGKDEEWMRKREGRQQTVNALSTTFADRDASPPDPGRTAKRVAVGATVLHVIAAPFLILRDLLKMQK